LAAVLTTVFATLGAGSAQDFMAEPGAPAAAFPKADRPVANIVSPIWHDEKERDAAGEPAQLVRLLAITSGITIADVGAGSGYYVARLSQIVGADGAPAYFDPKIAAIRPPQLRERTPECREVRLHSRIAPHYPSARRPAECARLAVRAR
jgi:predicted methyltransferase